MRVRFIAAILVERGNKTPSSYRLLLLKSTSGAFARQSLSRDALSVLSLADRTCRTYPLSVTIVPC